MFFVLEDEYRGPYDTEFTLLGDDVGEAPRCRKCDGFVGMLPSLPPYRVTLELYGREFGDSIRGFDCPLFTQRFSEAFRANELRGIQDFHPVEVTRVRRQRRGRKPLPPTYFYVQPTFGGAAVDDSRSRLRRAKPIDCDWCRATGVDAIHGFALEPDSWNGDDIFTPRGLTGTLVVSERFARLVTRHGFTNMRLIPTEEYTWDPLGRGPMS